MDSVYLLFREIQLRLYAGEDLDKGGLDGGNLSRKGAFEPAASARERQFGLGPDDIGHSLCLRRVELAGQKGAGAAYPYYAPPALALGRRYGRYGICQRLFHEKKNPRQVLPGVILKLFDALLQARLLICSGCSKRSRCEAPG